MRAGIDPDRCPQCGRRLDVDIGHDEDLTDPNRAPVTAELVCPGCGWTDLVEM